MAQVVSFPAKPKKVVSILAAPPIPPEVMDALGLTAGLLMIGGRFPAKQIGKDECRPLLRHAT